MDGLTGNFPPGFLRGVVIAFAFGLVLGIVGAGVFILAGGPGPVGEFSGLFRAGERETKRTVAGLERALGEQRERISELEASNQRLESSNSRLAEHIGDARRLSEELAVSVGTTAADISSAKRLHQKITEQVKGLIGVLNRGSPGGGGSGDMGGLDAQ
jgi:hypothetical protein